ncbi:hypothetical protein HZ326_19364 [Fusarium oxysporum f. sp. albedinis]|nr:hypothetical protein HZ326_19364 [Fusarium oxysporum f. sp. albedinis]
MASLKPEKEYMSMLECTEYWEGMPTDDPFGRLNFLVLQVSQPLLPHTNAIIWCNLTACESGTLLPALRLSLCLHGK